MNHDCNKNKTPYGFRAKFVVHQSFMVQVVQFVALVPSVPPMQLVLFVHFNVTSLPPCSSLIRKVRTPLLHGSLIRLWRAVPVSRTAIFIANCQISCFFRIVLPICLKVLTSCDVHPDWLCVGRGGVARVLPRVVRLRPRDDQRRQDVVPATIYQDRADALAVVSDDLQRQRKWV